MRPAAGPPCSSPPPTPAPLTLPAWPSIGLPDPAPAWPHGPAPFPSLRDSAFPAAARPATASHTKELFHETGLGMPPCACNAHGFLGETAPTQRKCADPSPTQRIFHRRENGKKPPGKVEPSRVKVRSHRGGAEQAARARAGGRADASGCALTLGGPD